MRSLAVICGVLSIAVVVLADLPPFEELKAQLSGDLVLPNDSAFKDAAHQWNSYFDGNVPLAVAYCVLESDVQAAIKFAKAHRVQVSIRSGGHSFGGWSVCPNCLVVDTSRMSKLKFDVPADGQAYATSGPGVSLEAFTKGAGPYNVTIPHGFGPDVYLGGFTLGGGVGLTHRKYGLTVDYLDSARVVLADGSIATASATENPDLLWALQGGGGGNFGVVTEYVYRATKVPSKVLYVNLQWGFSKGNVVALGKIWQAILSDPKVSDDFCLYWRIEGSPFGTWFYKVEIFGIWTGDLIEGRNLITEIIDDAPERPKKNDVIETTYDDAYLRFMTPYEHVPRAGFGLKHRLLDKPFPEEAFALLADKIGELGILQNFVLLWIDPMGGKIKTVAPDATAFPHRNVYGDFALFTFWLTDKSKDKALTWQEETMSGLDPFLPERAYVNFPDPNLRNWEKMYYAENYPRLQQIKAKYDPENFFSFAQSIRPATEE